METDIQLHQGDCLEVLKTLNDNSIDSVVTDPPYGINFMGKKWDYNVPNVEVWQQVLRVLKPGGHALVACGTRTQHRMAVNLEDAGFEIRDIVAWVYGSGFPKSQNIGKAVDKLQGNEREDLGENDNQRLNKPDTDVYEAGIRGKEARLTKGKSPYEGWGTALKPAMELFTLCRKPLEEKTIAKNVLKYGTGGINIDECRVGTDTDRGNRYNNKPSSYGGNDNGTLNVSFNGRPKIWEVKEGRFPANFIHDGSGEVVSKFPYTKSGNIKSGTYQNRAKKTNVAYGEYKNDGAYNPTHEANKGSASRFFYCAKASKSERNKGLEGFTEKQWKTNIGADSYTKSTHKILKRDSTRQNNHPTVKPIKLMKYLCRLITPVDGIVLDPYMGSGSTGIAAKEEGFNFTGIELDKDYFEIAKARINAKEAQEKLF